MLFWCMLMAIRKITFIFSSTDNHLLYLDPHTNQPYISVTEEGIIPDDTYHARHAERILINELDPSLALV